MPEHQSRSSGSRIAAVLMAALCMAGCAPEEATSAETPVASLSAAPPATSRPAIQPAESAVPPSPPGDLYTVLDPLSPGQPGELIRQERVAAPAGAIAWRVLYHSRTIAGDDIAVSGLIVAPDGAPPPGGFPVLAYAHGTTGLADACALSKRAQPYPGESEAATSLPLPELWTRGYVVAATDYEGLGTPGRHPYLVGESEGRGVLDIVRAARSIDDAHAGAPTIAIGVSQGGHAALFTGEIAPAYAPDVDLVAVVALAPAAELAQAAFLLTGDESVVGFAVAIGAGFAAAHAEADLGQILTPAALAAIDIVDTGCIDDVLAAYAGPARDTLRFEALGAPPWTTLLERNSPGRVRTDVPLFVGQGDADALVVPELTDALVVRLCALGDDVTYRRYTGASHDSVVEAAQDDVFGWIDDRLAGLPSGEGDCPR
jgi:alpha-beta hydrolase superfamily lysophospholipase